MPDSKFSTLWSPWLPLPVSARLLRSLSLWLSYSQTSELILGQDRGQSPSRSPLKKRNLRLSSVCALRVFQHPAQDTLAQESIPHSGPHVTASPRGTVGVETPRSSRLGLLPTRNEYNNPHPTRALQFQLLSVKGFVAPGLKAMLDESTEAVTKVTVVTVS